MPERPRTACSKGWMRDRLQRWRRPPEEPFPGERRIPSLPADASWEERYRAAVEAENRIIAETPGRWYVIRALLPLVLLAGILLYGVVTWVTGLLSG